MQYRNMFPENIELLAGFLSAWEEGVLLSQRLVERIESRQITIQPGDKILLTGVSVQLGCASEKYLCPVFRFLNLPQLDMVSPRCR